MYSLYPLVFIVILNWNGKDITAECLRSLGEIAYGNYEIVLVDNASTDGSQDFFRREFPQVRLIENTRNLGFTGGNNIGIRLALEKGADYVLLLNNDTVVDVDFLTELIEVGESDPNIGILCPKIYFHDQPQTLWYAGGEIQLWRGTGVKLKGGGAHDQRLFGERREVTFAAGCALLIKNRVIQDIGLLDERLFFYQEDTDWSIKAVKAGYKIIYVPEAKIWHRVGAGVSKAPSSFKLYLRTRNRLLIMRWHAGLLDWILFTPNFLVRQVLYPAIIFTIRRDYERLTTLHAAISDAITGSQIRHHKWLVS